MLTHGGKDFYNLSKGRTFFYDEIVETNKCYSVFKSGCNYYVLETRAIKFLKPLA